MAQRELVIVSSDLSGEPEAETLVFGFDGRNFEIDLTERERERLAKLLTPYIDVSRRVGGAKRGRPKSNGSSNGHSNGDSGWDPKLARVWAKEQGLEVPERGRIPYAVREAYEAGNTPVIPSAVFSAPEPPAEPTPVRRRAPRKKAATA